MHHAKRIFILWHPPQNISIPTPPIPIRHQQNNLKLDHLITVDLVLASKYDTTATGVDFWNYVKLHHPQQDSVFESFVVGITVRLDHVDGQIINAASLDLAQFATDHKNKHTEAVVNLEMGGSLTLRLKSILFDPHHRSPNQTSHHCPSRDSTDEETQDLNSSKEMEHGDGQSLTDDNYTNDANNATEKHEKHDEVTIFDVNDTKDQQQTQSLQQQPSGKAGEDIIAKEAEEPLSLPQHHRSDDDDDVSENDARDEKDEEDTLLNANGTKDQHDMQSLQQQPSNKFEEVVVEEGTEQPLSLSRHHHSDEIDANENDEEETLLNENGTEGQQHIHCLQQQRSSKVGEDVVEEDTGEPLSPSRYHHSDDNDANEKDEQETMLNAKDTKDQEQTKYQQKLSSGKIEEDVVEEVAEETVSLSRSHHSDDDDANEKGEKDEEGTFFDANDTNSQQHTRNPQQQSIGKDVESLDKEVAEEPLSLSASHHSDDNDANEKDEEETFLDANDEFVAEEAAEEPFSLSLFHHSDDHDANAKDGKDGENTFFDANDTNGLQHTKSLQLEPSGNDAEKAVEEDTEQPLSLSRYFYRQLERDALDSQDKDNENQSVVSKIGTSTPLESCQEDSCASDNDQLTGIHDKKEVNELGNTVHQKDKTDTEWDVLGSEYLEKCSEKGHKEDGTETDSNKENDQLGPGPNFSTVLSQENGLGPAVKMRQTGVDYGGDSFANLQPSGMPLLGGGGDGGGGNEASAPHDEENLCHRPSIYALMQPLIGEQRYEEEFVTKYKGGVWKEAPMITTVNTPNKLHWWSIKGPEEFDEINANQEELVDVGNGIMVPRKVYRRTMKIATREHGAIPGRMSRLQKCNVWSESPIEQVIALGKPVSVRNSCVLHVAKLMEENVKHVDEPMLSRSESETEEDEENSVGLGIGSLGDTTDSSDDGVTGMFGIGKLSSGSDTDSGEGDRKKEKEVEGGMEEEEGGKEKNEGKEENEVEKKRVKEEEKDKTECEETKDKDDKNEEIGIEMTEDFECNKAKYGNDEEYEEDYEFAGRQGMVTRAKSDPIISHDGHMDGTRMGWKQGAAMQRVSMGNSKGIQQKEAAKQQQQDKIDGDYIDGIRGLKFNRRSDKEKICILELEIEELKRGRARLEGEMEMCNTTTIHLIRELSKFREMENVIYGYVGNEKEWIAGRQVGMQCSGGGKCGDGDEVARLLDVILRMKRELDEVQELLECARELRKTRQELALARTEIVNLKHQLVVSKGQVRGRGGGGRGLFGFGGGG